MSVRATSVRAFIYAAAVVLGAAFFSSPPLLGSEKVRSIASLNADERAKLPDGTQVTLESGQTVSLGMLRAEHRARLERFSRASALGKMAAAKLVTVNPVSASAPGKVGSPSAPGKPVVGRAAQVGPNISAPPTLVPFNPPSRPGSGTLPAKDYLDFCKAANPSVCLYLPSNSTLRWLPSNPDVEWAVDVDPLIIDKSVCAYDGGFPDSLTGGCRFFYPVNQLVNFKPAGTLDTKAACDSPVTYYVDPKGAIRVSAYKPASGPITVGSTPATCIVQVWIESK